MADDKGFLKIRERKLPESRDTQERITDYNDVHTPLLGREMLEIAQPQVSRCMDCGIPFCHFACPLGNLIPEWNDLLYAGKIREAYERLSDTNNFPEFTGRICPALCEGSCTLGSNQPAVTICNAEQVIAEVAFNREYVEPKPAERATTKAIAIVGSGPAGLAAAQQLTRVGHTVVVYEKDEKPGGLLRYGIPNFKLEKSVIDRRLNQMKAEGTRFRCGVKIGVDITWDDLRSRFDAVLIATGTGIPNNIPIPGRDAEGIHFALDFLGESDISAKDKNVVIIGAGDTGSDCLGTSLRQGAKSVTSLQVLKKAPNSRLSEQPWPIWPTLYSPSSSEVEGEETGKWEMLYETTAVEFKSNSNGKVQSVVLANVVWDAVAKKFQPQPETKREIPADLVLISIGFRGPDTSELLSQMPVNVTERGLIDRQCDFTTSEQGVFVAGDAGRGQSLVVWAIAEGRSAAAKIDEYLQNGHTELPQPITATSSALRYEV